MSDTDTMERPKISKAGPGRPPGRPPAAGRKRAEWAIFGAKTLPLDVMLRLLHDDFVAYTEAYDQVRRGQPDAEAADHALTMLLAAREKALDSATKAAPYVHPRLASVDYAGQTETRLTVIRAPAVAGSADEWQKLNAPVIQLVPTSRGSNPVTWGPVNGNGSGNGT